MADVSNKVIKKEYQDKLMSVQDFRNQKAGGVTVQAIKYACDKDMIDFIQIDPRVRIIVLTPKTLEYKPNANKNRRTTLGL